MRINIYYGGRGLLDDPTLHVVKKMEQVLTELNVGVSVYNIYEYRNGISTLPNTLKEADGIILATTVEWLGIGGYMTEFLDACWLYGDKEAIQKIYMQPVVMSTTYGEREGVLTLENAWEILGGLPCSGLCGYVEDIAGFEVNSDYEKIIEKKAENLYRTISQKTKGLPTSNQAVRNNVMRERSVELTPQESELLSDKVSDDRYVEQQNSDIAELSGLYKQWLVEDFSEPNTEYVKDFKSHFAPQKGFSASYMFLIEGKELPLIIKINEDVLFVGYEKETDTDVTAKLSPEALSAIVAGRKTFMGAFNMGDMPAKGNFRMIGMLDNVFTFGS